MKNAKNTPKTFEVRLKRKLRKHFRALGIDGVDSESHNGALQNKEAVRLRHYFHREELLRESGAFVAKTLPKLLHCFASGNDVMPAGIKPQLEVIASGTWEADLFRLASLTWSVPVSEGYGRRIRFLVWDENNGKLIGLIALGDPVFNLHVRDKLIGWNADDRKARLTNVMDAYVLGALPPYNVLLGGKLVASLVRTRDVRDIFAKRYGRSTGIISGEAKRPKLVLVTTTSALGRSSVYNRLSLGGQRYFKSIGYTSGFGHFHVPNPVFEGIRDYLRLRKHSYCDENRFGNGPNWKFRTIRAALELMGVKRDLLQHGIRREVFVSHLARNSLEFLRGETRHVDYDGLLSASEVSSLAVERWLRPRAARRPEFSAWRREQIENLMKLDNHDLVGEMKKSGQ